MSHLYWTAGGGGDDLALLCYTSGTTSTLKGVAASHANELASGLAYSGMMGINPQDRVLVTLPLSFSYASTLRHMSRCPVGRRSCWPQGFIRVWR